MKLTKKGDLFVLLLIIFVILVFMIFMNFPQKNNLQGANVFLKGENILTIKEEGVYSIRNDEGDFLMNVEYFDNKIRVTDSTCQLHVCENTGWVDNPNQPIICVPNEIVVKPLGTNENSGIDIYTW